MKPTTLSYLAVALPTAAAAAAAAASLPILCQSQSQPNPIAAEYPSLTTGTINGTVAVLPIPFTLVRSIIPSQYRILDGYKALLPNFPADQYPVILEALLDHDVQSSGIHIPDFQRLGLSSPFVDLLGDGSSAFRSAKDALLTPSPVAEAGATAYGQIPIPCTFDPPCDGYAFVAPASVRAVYFKAYPGADRSLGGPPAAAVEFAPAVGAEGPYSRELYRSVTNQPSFSSGVACDNFVTLYNSSVTVGEYAPVVVKGSVSIVAPYFPVTTTFRDVYGLKVDRAFIENNYVAWSGLKGYSGTGSGD